MTRAGVQIALVALVAAGLALGAQALGSAVEGAGKPRLVGFDCIGAAGPIYANEESDFPPCLRIEESGL